MRSFRLSRVLLLSSAWAAVLRPLCALADNNAATETVAINPDGTLEKSEEELSLDIELKDAFEAANKSLLNYKEAKARISSLSESLVKDGGQENKAYRELQELDKLKTEITEKAKRIDSKIRDINARQIMELKDKISLLKERELKRRAKLKEKDQREKKASRLKMKGIPEDAVKKDQLEELIDLEKILANSDAELEAWFIELLKKEVAALQQELEVPVIDITQKIGELGEDDKAAILHKEEEDCSGATLKDAVQLVQESLVKYSQDRVGMADHLSRATVVHHLTSNNYIPPLPTHQQVEFSWWYQYLPDDWERFLDKTLPDGWRKWNAGLPDFVYHTLGLTSQAATAPPEAILKADIYPGSCWPMKGQSGQITLRLAYPVRVKAVTLDHAPTLLLENDERNSAPKQVRVFGYPPCWTKKSVDSASNNEKTKNTDYLDDYLDDGANDNDNIELVQGTCEDGLDFDLTKPVLLRDFQYDLEGPTIQTFKVISEEDDEVEEDGASCSDTAGTCGGASMFSADSMDDEVIAIGMEIISNWGNDDYTCVYRFRIHGDAIDED